MSASKQIFIVTAVVTVAVVAVAADEMRMDKLKRRFDIRSRDRIKERKKTSLDKEKSARKIKWNFVPAY